MRKYFLTVFCAVFSMTAFAQVNQLHRHTFLLNGGVSIPGSEFANATSIDVKDYVDKGAFLAGSYKYDLFRNLAIGVTGGYAHNKLNEQAIAEASATRVKTVPWTSTFFVADLYAQLPFRKWELFWRGSAGIALPNDWEFYAEQDSNNGTMIKGTTNTTDKINLAYITGIGLNYTAGNRIVVGFESNILAYKPTFDIDLNGSYGSRKEWIATLNQNLRVGYKF